MPQKKIEQVLPLNPEFHIIRRTGELGRASSSDLAEEFATSIKELREQYPHKRFQFVPLLFDTEGRKGIASLKAILAIAE